MHFDSFVFSRRRRHTRCYRDWSSDVCSSDLRCIAPAWPYDDRPVGELRATPDPRLAAIGIGEIVDHYDRIVRGLDRPILIGHSFGGLFVQMLLDRGLGAAGVSIDPAPPKGILPGPNAVRASLPVLMGWQSWSRIRTTPFESFQWGWVHTLDRAAQRPRTTGTSSRRRDASFCRRCSRRSRT